MSDLGDLIADNDFSRSWQALVDQYNADRPLELVLVCPLHHVAMEQTENTEEVSGPDLLKAVEFRCPEWLMAGNPTQCTYNVLVAVRPKPTPPVVGRD